MYAIRSYYEYFAKVLNACDFLTIRVKINDVLIDINKQKPEHFTRILDMKNGNLTREFDISMDDGSKVHIESVRFASMHEKEIGAIKYSITPINKKINVNLTSCVDGDVKNADTNYDEVFWSRHNVYAEGNTCCVTLRTRKTDFLVSSAINSHAFVGGNELDAYSVAKELCACSTFDAEVVAGQTLTLYKYFAVTTNRDYDVITSYSIHYTKLYEIFHRSKPFQ